MKFLYSQKTKPNFFDFRTIKKKKKSRQIVPRTGSNAPTPIYCWKKILKRFKRKVERNDDITYTQKKSNLFDEKNNGTVFNQKRKKKENHLWCFTKLKFKKKNTKKQNKTSRKILTANVSTIFFLSQAKNNSKRKENYLWSSLMLKHV